MKDLEIWELCSGFGTWSAPYKKAGYTVRRFEILKGRDVRLIQKEKRRPYGILAGPPCTHLASSGARWWDAKGEEALFEGLATVDACLRVIGVHRPKFWALENPVGRLSRYIGKPQLIFDPCDYGDPYTKKTCLWGKFNRPKLSRVEPILGSAMHTLPESKDRWRLRSATPPGFANAFFQANQ